MKGYMGKILVVDLGTGTCEVEKVPDQVYENLLHQMEATIRPMLVDDEHLQAELISRVGFSGNYLTHRETRDFTRKEYLRMWPPAGKTMLEIAREEAFEILHNHKPPPLPDGAAEKMAALISAAPKE